MLKVLLCVLCLCMPCQVSAFAVQRHLMEILPGTAVLGVPFIGVPFLSLDFGGTLGVRPTGQASMLTINGNVQPSDTHGDDPFEIAALQMRSASPMNVGSGPALYFATGSGFCTLFIHYGVQGEDTRFGGCDGSSMRLDFHRDSLQGVVDFSLVDAPGLAVDPGNYEFSPPPQAEVIPGVDHAIAGFPTGLEFWPEEVDMQGVGIFDFGTEGSVHLVFRPARVQVPELPGIVLMSFGLLLGLCPRFAKRASTREN